MMGSQEQLKIDVLLLLFQQPAGLPIASLPYQFLLFHGRQLDLQAHGYPSLDALLTDMSSMVELRSVGSGGVPYSLRLLLRVPGQVEEPHRPQALAPASKQPQPWLLSVPVIQRWPRFPHYVPVQPLRWAPPTRRAGSAAAAAPVRPLMKQKEEAGKPSSTDHSPVVPGKEAAPMANGEREIPMTYSEVLKSGGLAGGRSLVGCKPKIRPGLQAYKAGDPAAQSQDRSSASRRAEEQKVCPRGLLPDCPVKEWLLSVLKTRGYRDGLYTRKLASLCLKQQCMELSAFLSENRYGSLDELLSCVPEVEMVPGCVHHGDYVIRLRAGTKLDGGADPGRGPSLTKDSPSAHLHHAEPDSSFPQPAASPEVTESIPERVSLLLARYPEGLSTFQLRQAYRETYQRGLAVEGHPSLSTLLAAMGSTVSIRGLGVQARLFPRGAPGCSMLAEPETTPRQRDGDGKSMGNGQLAAELPEWTVTETGFYASVGLSP
ncbi:uncharacterized protein LOC134339054 isoform X1 [Mobula hypostoma]|uniref:uncharacterized protein LOC134339054 isoform X1 n=1 Tax=Mobula hypostoma TaxID=723540 RepID=UPI002FC33959